MTEIEGAVDIDGIAEFLGVSANTAYELARSGSIPGVKVGGQWRFWKADVKEFLNRPRDSWAQSARSVARKRAA